MSVYTFTYKTHYRKNITQEFKDLKPCSIHHTVASVTEICFGKRKEIMYVMTCGCEDCKRITPEKDMVAEIWNKWNTQRR